MRKINKGDMFQDYQKFLENKNPNDWSDLHDYDDVTNPVAENPAEYIVLTAWGEFVPEDSLDTDSKNKSLKTIELFNLNHNSLKNRRENYIKQVSAYKSQFSFEEICDNYSGLGFRSTIEFAYNY